MRHRDLTLIHRIENWSVANATARNALSVLPEDVGKVAYQQDNQTYWRLIDDSPITWSAITTGGPQGPQGIQGIPGTPGTPGTPGANGTNGAPGSVWREGAGVPSNSLGINGDFYLDGNTGNVYERVSGSYVLRCNIQGPAGSGGGGGGFVSVPTNSSSSGTAGSMAADSNSLYVCVATNSWIKIYGSTVFGTFSRTYASDGDSNGVIYFYGTQGLVTTFNNPQLLTPPMVVTASGVLGGTEDPLTALTDRAIGHFYTTNVANSWIKIDLGVGRSLVLNQYSVRSRSSFAGDWPLQWKLEGSNDDTTWTSVHVFNPVSPAYSGTDQWRSPAVAGQVTAYRYWKLTQTGANSGGTNYLAIGEIELYGSLKY